MLGLMLSLGRVDGAGRPVRRAQPQTAPRTGTPPQLGLARSGSGRGGSAGGNARGAFYALTLAAAAFAAACTRPAQPPAQPRAQARSAAPAVGLPESPRPSTPPGYRVSAHKAGGRQITISDVSRGRAVYVLKAGSAVYSTNGKRGTFLDNTFYFYKGSAVRLTLTAPTADLNMATYDVVLKSGVVAKNQSGVTLRADSMAYNDKTQLLTAAGHVNASDQNGDVLSGDRATADLDLQQIHMFNVVDTIKR